MAIKKIKLSTNAKKVIILCAMVGLLVVTGVLNLVLNEDSIVNKDPQNSLELPKTQETFFNSYRTDRQTQRAAQISYLDSIIATEGASLESIASAEEKKMSLIEIGQLELVCESLIKAKGFDDVVVTMSEDGVNIIVSDEELVQEEVSQILSVVLAETSYTPSDVTVISYQV